MTGLAMLHARGVLAPGIGRVRRTGSLPRNVEPLERALYAALHGSIGPRELASRKQVQRALSDVRHSLVECGLVRPTSRRVLTPALLVALPPLFLARLVALQVLGARESLVAVLLFMGAAVWFLPRRTVAGTRTLSSARERFNGPTERSQLGPDEAGLAVGLFGTTALQTLMPRFAWDAGLLDGGRPSNHLDNRLDSSTWGPNTDSFWN